MARCVSCGNHYRQTKFNNTNKCEDCLDVDSVYDADYDLEVETLVNPSGKTKPVFYDDTDDQS